MSGPRTDKTGQIQKAQATPEQQVAGLIQRLAPEIMRALPKHITADRISRIYLTAIRTTPELVECSRPSLLGCMLSAAQLGLECNTPLGLAYLIPRNSRKAGGKECTLQIGYKGMMDLVRRSGQASKLQAHVVREGDDFAWERGSNEFIRHVPSGDSDREARPITHAWAMAKVNGEIVFEVLTKEQIDQRRKRSSAGNYGPWVTDYEAMAKKTAMRALCTWLPQSAEVSRAEALEVADETGGRQSTAYDPAITQALGASGLIEESHEPRDSAPVMTGEPVPDVPPEAIERQPGED